MEAFTCPTSGRSRALSLASAIAQVVVTHAAMHTRLPLGGDGQVDRASTSLVHRRRLDLDPGRNMAIKRDTREFEVSVPAELFARSFAECMADPGRRFGPSRVVREADRFGHPFRVGERFQGRFDLAVLREGRQERSRRLAKLLGNIAKVCQMGAPSGAVSRFFEDQLSSIYAEITELQLSQLPARVTYSYLEGTPMAGASSFEIDALLPELCRVKHVFEFQEVNTFAAVCLTTTILQLHLNVVWHQIDAVASANGGQVLRCDIPELYRTLT